MSKKLPSIRDHGGLYPTVDNIGEPMMPPMGRAGFREGWSVARPKKVTDDTDGMPNWVLFGDLAEAP